MLSSRISCPHHAQRGRFVSSAKGSPLFLFFCFHRNQLTIWDQGFALRAAGCAHFGAEDSLDRRMVLLRTLFPFFLVIDLFAKRTLVFRFRSLPMFDNRIDQTVFLRLFRSHEMVSIHILYKFLIRMASMLDVEICQHLLAALELLILDLYI